MKTLAFILVSTLLAITANAPSVQEISETEASTEEVVIFAGHHRAGSVIQFRAQSRKRFDAFQIRPIKIESVKLAGLDNQYIFTNRYLRLRALLI